MASAFLALLARDAHVLKANLQEFIPRTVLQPLMLVFVLTYVFPKIGSAVGGSSGAGGFSTLLVAGVLVDDAIVEIENIMRHLRMGKTPYQAAMEAADEIGLAVIATTFTLIAVFLPTAFMAGVPGKFFVQFGWTAAIGAENVLGVGMPGLYSSPGSVSDAEELANVDTMLQAMGEAGEAPESAKAQVVVGDALALPYPDGSFDTVIASEILEHIPDDDGVISELIRVLRPGGTFLFLLNHPLLQTPDSGWIDDQILDPPEQYWRIGAYLPEAETVEHGTSPTWLATIV